MAQIDQKAFTEGWIVHLMDSMEEHLDEETRAKVLESCGRACARSGPVHVARECQGDLDRWLATLRKWHGGEEHIQQDGDVVRVTCTECLCPAAKDIPQGLSDTYCLCSLGWMKETFEAVMGRPVAVELLQCLRLLGDDSGKPSEDNVFQPFAIVLEVEGVSQILIPRFDEGQDSDDQSFYRIEPTAVQCVALQQSEPDLHLVQP